MDKHNNIEELANKILEAGHAIKENTQEVAVALKKFSEKLEEEEKVKDWTKHQDELIFNDFLIKANFSNWEVTKKYYKRHTESNEKQGSYFYLEIKSYLGGTAVEAINVQQAKQLRDYLTEKIIYLEENTR